MSIILTNLNFILDRYVDDILAASEKEQDSLNFLNFLDSKYPIIKFTLEKQVNNFIAFLDFIAYRFAFLDFRHR